MALKIDLTGSYYTTKEGLCAVVWRPLVSHPALKLAQTKWESLDH